MRLTVVCLVEVIEGQILLRPKHELYQIFKKYKDILYLRMIL